ncbi:hypothetical protein A0H81_03966 [Grifola frondosa]|uniref:Uncharacterized protein n=1 Tax=Grifola frondosa TaxID=5627 RepID=A0A1C7MH03_GRIFR|nr:hypothetical protein A0H81_03966 [Grifola frondosa]
MVGELPREMTLEERVWWANPYLRMLSSPLRKCFETEQMLPRDFLLRLSAMRVKTPRLGKPAQALFPDGLEHPAFSGHKAGVGHYIICWKDAFKQLQERGSYRRLSSNVFMHSLLELQIGHLLRVRVLQELKILADRLQRSPKALEYTPSLRRLTRVEWNNVNLRCHSV